MRSQTTIPPTRDLVLIGGGHAHAIVLRRFAMRPLPGARLTLIDPHPFALYSGMLPGHIAGAYSLDEISIDLVKLARWAGARLVLDRVEGLDLAEGRARLTSGRAIGFDLASINTGSTSGAPTIADPDHLLIPVKPLDRFLPRLERFLRAASETGAAPRVVVIGAGVGGCELALSLRARLAARRPAGAAPAQITVLEEASSALGMLAEAPRRSMLKAMEERGVALRLGARVQSAGTPAADSETPAVALTLESGETIEADAVFVAAGAQPPSFIAESGLATDDDGFIAVDRYLRSTSHPDVFAAGDSAAMVESPRAKAGVFAVRQGPALANNLECALRGRPMRPYHPQSNWLKLVTLGEGRAIGEKAGMALDGGVAAQKALWRWKDWIDRRFMARLTPPPLVKPHPPARAALGVKEAALSAPLCGGCGAKVGEGTLRAALAQLIPGFAEPAGLTVLRGLGDDAAVLRLGGGDPFVWTTDHYRALVEDPHLLARIAVTHALGDIRAMGAEPAAALLSLTLPEASGPLQARDLEMALDGACRALEAAGAQLVGGHSALGAELSIGVTAIGQAVEQEWRSLSDGAAGEVLALTRPIGSGVLLAGEMAMRARGADVASAWRMMTEDRGAESRLLARACGAMTDITGFGLAGHLLGILEASGVDAELSLDAVPLLKGAAELAAQGVESSLAPANRARSLAAIQADPEARAHPVFPLLTDPQTAGGFLVSIAEHRLTALADTARETGVTLTRIGRLTERAGAAPTITLRA